MDFNLNEFLIFRIQYLGCNRTRSLWLPTNHSKPIANITSRFGIMIQMNPEEFFDLSSLSFMHDNRVTTKILDDQMKLTLKEKIVRLKVGKSDPIVSP